MLIGVDGTGPADDGEYERAMRNSFVSRLVRESRETYSVYRRGPALLGVECEGMAAQLVEVIQQRVAGAPDDTRIFLAGYSRGGAIVIRMAQLLQHNPYAGGASSPLRIAFMALFDAVDREPLSDTSVIPGNVDIAYLARQDYESSASRPYFYNWGLTSDCGSSIEPPGVLRTQQFRATHAGMGGVPWTGDHPLAWDGSGDPRYPTSYTPAITEAQDRAGSAAVHDWMWRKMRLHGMLP